MTETEIQMFIETMEDLGDEWTPEQVKTMYGDYTYEAAVKERKQHIDMPHVYLTSHSEKNTPSSRLGIADKNVSIRNVDVSRSSMDSSPIPLLL